MGPSDMPIPLGDVIEVFDVSCFGDGQSLLGGGLSLCVGDERKVLVVMQDLC